MPAAGASQSLARAGLAALCGIVTRNARPALAQQAQHTHLQRSGQVPLAGWRAQQLGLSVNSLWTPHLAAAATAPSCTAPGTFKVYCLRSSGCTATCVGLAVLRSARAQLTAGCSSLCKERQMCLHLVCSFRPRYTAAWAGEGGISGATLGCCSGCMAPAPTHLQRSGSAASPATLLQERVRSRAQPNALRPAHGLQLDGIQSGTQVRQAPEGTDMRHLQGCW